MLFTVLMVIMKMTMTILRTVWNMANYEYGSSDDDEDNTNYSDDSNNGEYKQSKNRKRTFGQKEFNKKRQVLTGEPSPKQRLFSIIKLSCFF